MSISAETADWNRERKNLFDWVPSKSLLASIRCYQHYADKKGIFAYAMKKLSVLRHRFWSVVTGADIPLNSTVGGGLLLPHPNGVVIHPDAVIGPNCLIFQQVTIGTRAGQAPPVIGGHVDIGAGAKVLGAVVIGDHARIGANAVVVTDVPPGKTVLGIPAALVD